MEYQVSEKVRDSFQKLTENEKVQKALAFMEADQEEIIAAAGYDPEQDAEHPAGSIFSALPP